MMELMEWLVLGFLLGIGPLALLLGADSRVDDPRGWWPAIRHPGRACRRTGATAPPGAATPDPSRRELGAWGSKAARDSSFIPARALILPEWGLERFAPIHVPMSTASSGRLPLFGCAPGSRLGSVGGAAEGLLPVGRIGPSPIRSRGQGP